MYTRYEQRSASGNVFGLCEAFDMERIGVVTQEDAKAWDEWERAVQPARPPHDKLPPGGQYVFKAGAAERYSEWVALRTEVAIFPVSSREIDPTTVVVVWEDVDQAYVFPQREVPEEFADLAAWFAAQA